MKGTEKDIHMQVSENGHVRLYREGKLQSPSFIVGEEAAPGISPLMFMTDETLRAVREEVAHSLIAKAELLLGRTLNNGNSKIITFYITNNGTINIHNLKR